MEIPAHAPTGGWLAVVSPQFCAPYPVDLTVTKKALSLSDGSFTVTDVNGAVMFRVKGTVLSLHDRRVLLDAAGNPLLSMRNKIFTAHKRWQVFRGESSDPKDLLFSVKMSSMLQLKTELDVCLAANVSENACDFKIKGSYLERSCTIYLGDTTNMIAQMRQKYTAASIMLDKDTYMVTVYPNVDHAFITALIVILDEINDGD